MEVGPLARLLVLLRYRLVICRCSFNRRYHRPTGFDAFLRAVLCVDLAGKVPENPEVPLLLSLGQALVTVNRPRCQAVRHIFL